jgi:hypothetical protein
MWQTSGQSNNPGGAGGGASRNTAFGVASSLPRMGSSARPPSVWPPPGYWERVRELVQQCDNLTLETDSKTSILRDNLLDRGDLVLDGPDNANVQPLLSQPWGRVEALDTYIPRQSTDVLGKPITVCHRFPVVLAAAGVAWGNSDNKHASGWPADLFQPDRAGPELMSEIGPTSEGGRLQGTRDPRTFVDLDNNPLSWEVIRTAAQRVSKALQRAQGVPVEVAQQQVAAALERLIVQRQDVTSAERPARAAPPTVWERPEYGPLSKGISILSENWNTKSAAARRSALDASLPLELRALEDYFQGLSLSSTAPTPTMSSLSSMPAPNRSQNRMVSASPPSLSNRNVSAPSSGLGSVRSASSDTQTSVFRPAPAPSSVRSTGLQPSGNSRLAPTTSGSLTGPGLLTPFY